MAKKQTAVAVAPEVLDLGGSQDDMAYAQEVGTTVLGFLKQAAAFFATAKRYEEQSVAVLEMAKSATVTSEAEDVRAQEHIRATSAARKAVEDHWSITSVVHQLHRRLTARRDVAAKNFSEAGLVWNRLHNTYVEKARAAAREAEERLRREAEARALADRERALAALDAAATKAEEASSDLSEREKAFVDFYVVTNNAPESARRAGFRQPDTQALRLLKAQKVQRAIEAWRAAESARQQRVALAQAQLEVEHIDVRPAVSKAVGASDRTTWRAEVLDAEALIEAVFAGKHGIPRDVLRVDEVKLNQYARDLHRLIDRWPGVRAVSSTKVV